MQSVRIKICGITRGEDARAAAEAGADALGFMFYAGSQRHVTVGQCREMVGSLPPFISRVGVFVDPLEEEVFEAMEVCGLDTLQFHGGESPDFCQQFPARIIKAFRIKDEASLEELPAFPTDAWLLDSYVPGEAGGTGETFNWRLAVAARSHGVPIILAGGLNPDNVARALSEVCPYGIDVSSGVESAPGMKDAGKIARFIRAARGASIT